jgi:hypothetical protein
MQKSVGVIDYLSKLATQNNGIIKVRILTPNDSSIEESLQGLKDNSVNIKYIEPKSGIG